MLSPVSISKDGKNIKAALGISIEVAFQTSIIDAATGIATKINPPKKNLVLDIGLNAFAKSTHATTPAESFLNLNIGSGTNPNSFASGAITFVQATTVVTASGGFFTSAMVGAILKYGTGSGGTEQYITAFTNATTVSVSSSATVPATVGTVWMVQQTALQTQLFSTNTYRTLAGDNGTTFTSGTMVMKRTFINPTQVSSYNVNELGWYLSSAGVSFGRVTLSSTDTVPPTSFYQVVMTLTITISPNAPSASPNVGTGFNSAGNVMVEWFAFNTVNSSGGVVSTNTTLDATNPNNCTGVFVTGTAYTQQTSLTSSTVPFTYASAIGLSSPAWVYTGGSVGICTHTSTLASTTTGQTCVGIGLQRFGANALALDVLLTTPFALPNGIFQPTMVWQCTYGRTLTN